MSRFVRVAAALLRTSLMTAFQYRSNFVVEFVVGAFSTLTFVLPLLLVFDHAPAVAGWTFHQALLVTAFFYLLQGLIAVFVEPNLAAVVEGVRTGQLDFLLIKPVDAQVLASLQKVAPARIWDLVASALLGAWAFSALPPPTPASVAATVALVLAGLAAMYGLWLGAICLSFWFVRVDNLRYLLGAVIDAGRWPISVYRGWVRLVLTVFIPVALTTSVPAMALLGRIEGPLALQAVAVGAGAVALSRLLWTRALRNYTSASS